MENEKIVKMLEDLAEKLENLDVTEEVVEEVKEEVKMDIKELRNDIMAMRKGMAELMASSQGLRSVGLLKGLLEELEELEHKYDELAEEVCENGGVLFTDEEVAKLSCKVVDIKGMLHTVAFFDEETPNHWYFLCSCKVNLDGIEVIKKVGDEGGHMWVASDKVCEKVVETVHKHIDEVIAKFGKGGEVAELLSKFF